jgi:nitrate reductase NapAB chaperone NapD
MKKISDKGLMILKIKKEEKYNSYKMNSKIKNLMGVLSIQISFIQRKLKGNQRDPWSNSWRIRRGSWKRSIRRLRI